MSTELALPKSSQMDVIVIGAGFAGLAAAIEAAEAGASVVVLEKMSAPGGNSIISDGGIAAPGTVYQENAGILDSPKLMYDDMMKAGEGLNYPELVKLVTERAREAFLWSRDYLGVKYKNRVDTFGGHSVPRSYVPETISGAPLIKQQLARLKELQVPICTGVYVESLIQDEVGRVEAVRVRDGYRFNSPKSGAERVLTASQAIIAAAGGFGGDVAYRQSQDPRLDNAVASTNKRSATGEILKECLRIGANPVQLSHIQLGPWTSPDEEGFGAGPLFGYSTVLPYGLILDPATGRRFVCELTNRKNLAEAILKRGHPVVGIADEIGVRISGWDFSRALQREVVRTFDTLEELSAYYGMDPAVVTDSVRRYNGYILSGKDEEFQKPYTEGAGPLNQSPFYAMRFWPKVHYTMGGIQIDTSARVIHREQYPIPGLYAAGEITGGVHGACRLANCAITDCLVMGRVAGRQAALTEKN